MKFFIQKNENGRIFDYRENKIYQNKTKIIYWYIKHRM